MNREYQIVSGYSDMKDFAPRVGKEMQGGWKCQGGIAVILDERGDAGFVYFQAMIRESLGIRCHYCQREIGPDELLLSSEDRWYCVDHEAERDRYADPGE